MREIKFRAWDKFKKEWIDFSREPLNCYGKGQNGFNLVTDENIDWVWMQYTGLKDIDGKEIYEGDVVGHYVAEEIGGPRTFESFRSEIIWWPDMVDVSRARVIGNIYENPELLKGDEA